MVSNMCNGESVHSTLQLSSCDSAMLPSHYVLSIMFKVLCFALRSSSHDPAVSMGVLTAP